MLNLRSKLITLARGLWYHSAKLDDTASNPRMHALQLTHSAEEVAQGIVSWANHAGHWTVECQDRLADGFQLHLVRTTRLLKFSDDIHVRITSSAAKTRVDAESRSRVGKGDFGQNTRNLLELVHAIEADEFCTQRG